MTLQSITKKLHEVEICYRRQQDKEKDIQNILRMFFSTQTWSKNIPVQDVSINYRRDRNDIIIETPNKSMAMEISLHLQAISFCLKKQNMHVKCIIIR